MEIISKQNDKLKNVKKLHLKKYREEQNLFLVESEKLILEAVACGYKIKELFLSRKFDSLSEVCNNVYHISEDLMKNITTFVTQAGCIAVVQSKPKPPQKGLFLVLENLQDPSNMGAIIRTAFGAGFGTVYCVNCADVYESKALRASMGAVFHLSVITADFEVIKNLNKPLMCASMEGENIYKINKSSEDMGFVIGNEGHGVSKEMRKLCTKIVSIPMQNGLESLNASVSAGLIMYAIKYNLMER